MNDFYVYTYLDPRKKGLFEYGEYEFEYEPFYVGKGKNRQWKRISSRSDHFKRIINKIKENGLEPIVVKIKENMIEDDSFLLDIELIKAIRRQESGKGPLVNFTIGGEGSSGYKFSEETLEKRRKDFSYIKRTFEGGCKLLTEEKDYKNRYTKLNYICPKGHRESISWSSFQIGHRCPKCNKINKGKIL